MADDMLDGLSEKEIYDVLVIGGGAAGLAGAIKAQELGMKVIVIENGERIGGIPLQCIHPGFGNFYYGENLTGPEFAERLIGRLNEMNIGICTETHVMSMDTVSDDASGMLKEVKVVTSGSSCGGGIKKLYARTIIYAAGARERNLYEVGITGDRVGGVYTAGEAQTLMDVHGIMPGRKVVIIGSGDIGLIMARRFALEGAEVAAVVEMLPYPGGLQRNVVQCLDDFGIPLLTSHMVKEIRGRRRVERVVLSEVDDKFMPTGNGREIECDTVALAVGLVPNVRKLEETGIAVDPSTNGPVVNEYMETSVPGVFAAGNALAINDYVDYAAEQGERAAIGARAYIKNEMPSEWKKLGKGRNIRIAFPHYISGENDVRIYARVSKPMENARIHFPEIGKERKAARLMPGEMIIMNLSREELEGAGEITMEAE